ncbi:MAG: hypothetical protein J3K34DRAFT_442208, partial [Monoraphidium minutum]
MRASPAAMVHPGVSAFSSAHLQSRGAFVAAGRPRRARGLVVRSAAPPPKVDNGFSLLTWTSKLVPQGALVTGAKTGWRLAWQAMVRELAPQDSSGGYTRPQYSFDGVLGSPEFPAAAGRYHLYVGNACPWCHRVLLALALRGLSGAVSVTRLLDIPEARDARRLGDAGRGRPRVGCGRPVGGVRQGQPRLQGPLHRAAAGGQGGPPPRVQRERVPRATARGARAAGGQRRGAAAGGAGGGDRRPQRLDLPVHQTTEFYRCGFATSQAAYDRAAAELHGALARRGRHPGRQPLPLAGDRFTEADLRLFPTVVRFDAVYAAIFRA